jgi:hypothetical protein
MTKYDLEDLCADIATVLQTNLNSKLSEIDSEKNDGIVLKQVTGDAYFFQELNNKVANFDPFVLYGVESVQTLSQEGAAAQVATISVVIVVSDPGLDPELPKRMIRYARALHEIFEENYSLLRLSSKLIIQNLMPVSFNLLNSSQSYRAAGVNLIAGLA